MPVPMETRNSKFDTRFSVFEFRFSRAGGFCPEAMIDYFEFEEVRG